MKNILPKFIDLLKIIYYEIKSNFVIQKMNYRVEGSCKKCGDCCRYMYSRDTYNEREFELMTKIFPKYKRFKIIGKDKFGNLIFACKLLDKSNLCTDYKHRLKMCKNYPSARLNSGAKLHKNCGFRIIPEKSFRDYLNQ